MINIDDMNKRLNSINKDLMEMNEKMHRRHVDAFIASIPELIKHCSEYKIFNKNSSLQKHAISLYFQEFFKIWTNNALKDLEDRASSHILNLIQKETYCLDGSRLTRLNSGAKNCLILSCEPNDGAPEALQLLSSSG